MKAFRLIAIIGALALTAVACNKNNGELEKGKFKFVNSATSKMNISLIQAYTVGDNALSYSSDCPLSPGETDEVELYNDENFYVKITAAPSGGASATYISNNKSIKLPTYKKESDVVVLTFPDDFTKETN